MSNDDARIFRFNELDAETAEDLLNGAHVDRYSQVSDLFVDLQPAPGRADDPAFDQVASRLVTRRRRRTLPVAIAGVAAAAAISFGGVAAASNALPTPVQSVTSSAGAHVGFDIPKPLKAEEKAKAKAESKTNGASETGPSTSSTTTAPNTTTTAVHPGSESCAEARKVEGAKGCSAVAKEHAPGQANKTTTSTSVVSDSPATEADEPSDNSSSKSKGHTEGAGKSSQHGKGKS